MFSRVSRQGPTFRVAVRLYSPARFYSDAKPEPKHAIGFIGLGQMGRHMATNLLKAGHPLVLYDATPASLQRFRDLPANYPTPIFASSALEVAERAPPVVVTMLPSSPHVREVYSGDRGLLRAAAKGTLLIDCSTIDPSTAREVAKMGKDRGVEAIDAPVSGGVPGAEAGTLTFMVGGPAESFKRAEPILQNMGKKVVHCGANGNGQVAKICNNMLLGISMVGAAEAMNLGVRLGMDPNLLASILNSSSGRCWSSEIYNPYPGVVPNAPASRDYEGGFGVPLMAKDLSLAVDAADGSDATIVMGRTAARVYTEMMERGDKYKTKDFSIVLKWLAEDAKSSGL